MRFLSTWFWVSEIIVSKLWSVLEYRHCGMILSTSSLNNFKCRSIEFRNIIQFCKAIIYFISLFWKRVYIVTSFCQEHFQFRSCFINLLMDCTCPLSLSLVSEGIALFRISSPFRRQCLEYCSTSCMPKTPSTVVIHALVLEIFTTG